MSEIRVNTIVNEGNTTGPVLAGITTVSDTTQSTSTADGALVISGGVGIAKSLNVGGNVTVGGTLTYEDVTNQDVLGLSTYRSGLNVGSAEGSGTGVGITFTEQGNAYFAKTGIVTATQFVGLFTGTSGLTVGVGTTATIINLSSSISQTSFGGALKEKCSIQSTNVANAAGTIDLAQGNVHYYTTNGSGQTTADIIYKGGNNVSGFMTTGDNIALSVLTKPNSSEYIDAVTIDGAAVTEKWSSDSAAAPSSANSGTYDLYSINIIRVDQTGTPNTDYIVLCNRAKYN